MKSILAVIVALSFLYCGVVRADDCENTKWLEDAVKSDSIPVISSAREKLTVCIVQYAGVVKGINTMQSVMMFELDKDPTNEVLKRLVNEAKELADGNRMIVKKLAQIHNKLGELIIAIKKTEMTKKKEVNL